MSSSRINYAVHPLPWGREESPCIGLLSNLQGRRIGRCRDDGLQAMMLVNPWWLGQDRLLLIISVKNESRSRE